MLVILLWIIIFIQLRLYLMTVSVLLQYGVRICRHAQLEGVTKAYAD